MKIGVVGSMQFTEKMMELRDELEKMELMFNIQKQEVRLLEMDEEKQKIEEAILRQKEKLQLLNSN